MLFISCIYKMYSSVVACYLSVTRLCPSACTRLSLGCSFIIDLSPLRFLFENKLTTREAGDNVYLSLLSNYIFA
jgi:hypothetical protein